MLFFIFSKDKEKPVMPTIKNLHAIDCEPDEAKRNKDKKKTLK